MESSRNKWKVQFVKKLLHRAGGKVKNGVNHVDEDLIGTVKKNYKLDISRVSHFLSTLTKG